MPIQQPAPPRRRSWGGFLAGVGLVLLVVIAFWGAYFLRPESTVGAPTPEFRTELQVKGLELAVLAYWQTYHKLPAGTASNIIAVFAARNADGQNPMGLAFMNPKPPQKDPLGHELRGDVDGNGNYLDGWNRPFLIWPDVTGGCVVVRSVGPNGFDDGGAGDDITRVLRPAP